MTDSSSAPPLKDAEDARVSSYERVRRIDDAYGYCIDHDRWPDGFNPFDAIRDLLAEVHAYRRSLVAHHDIATLSDATVRESIGGPCQVCARAQRWSREAVMDFPAAWAYIRESHPDPTEHDPKCSWVQTSGGMLCDCRVLWDEYDQRLARESSVAADAVEERQGRQPAQET